ncbi:MAG: carboxylating nicotinate-nucleotide diphosphorylase [Ignavibacteriaceae bacterium]|jgi:nicotinate-nucleotide pyrophosphorylase (carboxylating)|nr:carboxylating nicotinate-nucleotide diphosphorylase [Ignavibacteriaceae bacterium]
MKLDKSEIKKIIKRALKEDIAKGDITTNAIISKKSKSIGRFLVKSDGVICGLSIAKMVFEELDKNISFKMFCKDGDFLKAGTIAAEIKGSERTLLTGERTALNFMQRLSGIATMAHFYSEKLKDSSAQLLDTRKTAPGLRMLDKYAVKKGGGKNHRIGLFDMVLIKDNHIKAASSITKAVSLIRKKYGNKFKIEVETKNIDEVREALETKADIIMLDNMSIEIMKEAVKIIAGKAKTEASGNITSENIAEVASTGVDFISVGALTHSVKALDISMKI